MKKIILSGCMGKMGHVISDMVAERHDCVITAGFDLQEGHSENFPVFQQPEKFSGTADVLIDFSHPSFFDSLLSFAVARKIPAVVATTGLTGTQRNLIAKSSSQIPIFFSANMSLGVNLMTELCKKAAAVLGDSFDIEIIEKHHNQKIDAPSGTALMIADSISSVLSAQPQYIYDRHSQRKKREKNEIGIHTVRGGTIVGEHEVIFAGHDEIISIKHTAMSKQIFANGAINAALFLCAKKPGLYDMGDLLRSV